MHEPSGNQGPVLSIILPMLNEAAHIERILQALAPLRQRGAEVLLVDGGSHDASAQLAQGLGQRVMTAGRGRARQMNAGAAAAHGRALLFLHADTVLPLQADQIIADALRRSGRRWGRFDVRISGRARMLKWIARMMNWRSRLSGIATGDQAIFVLRDEFFTVGGFPQQALMEDIEISRRLKKRSPPLCLRQQVVTSGRRWETHGVWRTIFLMWRLRFLYWLGVSADTLAKQYK